MSHHTSRHSILLTLCLPPTTATVTELTSSRNAPSRVTSSAILFFTMESFPSALQFHHPLAPRRTPERGSLASHKQPRPAKTNHNTNFRLMTARNNLLSWLPWRKDVPLRGGTASTGHLEPTRAPEPRTRHHAPPDVDLYMQFRQRRFAMWRAKAGIQLGGGLRWGNVALTALRWGQLGRMWEACLVRSEQSEQAWRDGGLQGREDFGVWARVKKKIKRIGRALGLILREKRTNRVQAEIEVVGDW